MVFSRIVSVGHYVPSRRVTNDELSKTIDTSHEWIYSRTGIKSRHLVSDDENTSVLGYRAALAALTNAKMSISDVDGIIVSTSTPDRTFPSTACLIQKELAMTHGFAFDIQAVCSGFVYGISVANAMIVAKQARKILVIGADVMSKIINWQDRTTCVLFGDGAGAALLEATSENPISMNNSGILGADIYSDGQYAELLRTDACIPNDQKEYITMQGQEVFKLAVTKLVESSKTIMDRFGIKSEDIDLWVPHQANMRIVDNAANKLGFKAENVLSTISDFANTSAASIPISLSIGIAEKRIENGSLVLLGAMGGGFTWGAALVRF